MHILAIVLLCKYCFLSLSRKILTYIIVVVLIFKQSQDYTVKIVKNVLVPNQSYFLFLETLNWYYCKYFKAILNNLITDWVYELNSSRLYTYLLSL